MKQLFVSLCLCLIVFSACNKDDELLEIDVIEVEPHSIWETENFKNDYDIQFPDNYEGNGMVGFEGNLFLKNRADEAVELSYSFCDPLFCNDFGNALVDPLAISIIGENKNGIEVALAVRKEFVLNEQLVGIFYHNVENNATGQYFMKQENNFLEGLTVYFSNTAIEEVEAILKTIVEK